MSPARRVLVEKAFKKADTTEDGVLTGKVKLKAKIRKIGDGDGYNQGDGIVTM